MDDKFCVVDQYGNICRLYENGSVDLIPASSGLEHTIMTSVSMLVDIVIDYLSKNPPRSFDN